MSAPQVYKAVTAVAAELSGGGIPKRHRNERDDYRYRSIDDVLNKLSPLLAKHKLCVLPRVLERECTDRLGEGDLLLMAVTLKVAFDLVSSTDGSSHTVEVFGEALDASDKATAKAMSSAYKHAMLQAFCVPVAQIEDADASSHRLKRNRSHQREPVEGWAMWTSGIVDIVESCGSIEAVERMRQRQRPLLTAISREKPDLYAQIGAAFAKRAAELNGERCAISQLSADGEGCADCVSEAVRTEPPIRSPTGRSREREAAAERADGEGCAKRKARRPSKPARSHPRKQTEDASATAPEPA
jgi:ERF superfamily